MRIFLLSIIGIILSNCSNSYVKNKKTITSPNDLQKFVNVYCNKNKQTDKVIKVCGNGWSKDLNISKLYKGLPSKFPFPKLRLFYLRLALAYYKYIDKY